MIAVLSHLMFQEDIARVLDADEHLKTYHKRDIVAAQLFLKMLSFKPSRTCCS
ncbi:MULTISPECIES: hypothetical protein [Bradyrhizobium]|uniref:hypothetical protein n=1 Tax=Bradyrhizobium TaxID=374 RepID=UPI0004BC2339|nr:MULTISPECIES: hypothetical protein [Bradyrhizobium]MCA1543501.1 hypothetical protein [Bradyrhizobium sp. NBAIM32]UWU93491.1 hypothetical protein N2604_05940 [Bradyrhizobium sp. CB1015]